MIKMIYILSIEWKGVPNLTLLHAAERECILAHKIISWRLVIVFHHKAHHGQLRGVDRETESIIPHGVEPCRGSIQVGKRALTSAFLNIKWPAVPSIQTWPLVISFAVKKAAQSIFCTVVLDVSGLLLGLVQRNAVNLHSNQRIHNRVFLDIDFGQLLTTNHLKYIHEWISEVLHKVAKQKTQPKTLHSVPVRWGRWVCSCPVCAASLGQIFSQPLSWNRAWGRIHSCRSVETAHRSGPSLPQQSGNSTQLKASDKNEGVPVKYLRYPKLHR